MSDTLHPTATSGITPLHKRILRSVAFHELMTAREVSLDVNVVEATARAALDSLAKRDLIFSHHNGRATLWRVTARGRETVALMARERIARADQEAILATADPASLVTCPTCHGERVFCATCVGCRVVTAEQAAMVSTPEAEQEQEPEQP